MNIKSVTAESLGMGAAIERLNDGFQQVLENIHDPNTHAEAVRQFTLTIKIKPKKDRNNCEYAIGMSTKLPGAKPVVGILFVGKQKGQICAFENDPDQLGIFSAQDFNKQENINIVAKERENDD